MDRFVVISFFFYICIEYYEILSFMVNVISVCLVLVFIVSCSWDISSLNVKNVCFDGYLIEKVNMK